MRGKKVPWESVPGPAYSSRELKPRKKWVTAGCWFLCIFLIIGGLITPYRIAVLFGGLYILVLLMKKDVAVTQRGLEIFYDMRITTQYDFWPWEDIEALIREDRNHPELVALHFGKGGASKRFFFTRRDSDAIMALARQKNRRILVHDADENEMVGYKKYKRHY